MPNYKQLCAELVEKLDELNCHYNVPNQSAMIERALAALAEAEPQRRCLYSPVQIAECGGPCEQGPEHCDCGELCVTEPEPEGPTDEELMKLAREWNSGSESIELEFIADYARAVLARWGK